MANAVRVSIVGDHDPSRSTHTATDEALAWLAGEYLRAFGSSPCGLPVVGRGAGGTRSAALSAIETVKLDGGYLLPAGDLEGFEAAEAPGPDAVDLLPKWDCYTIVYAPDGRQRLVHPDTQERVYTPTGDGLGVVLVNGAAAGAWIALLRGAYGGRAGHCRSS
jgi:hypothetical protein